MHEIKFKAMGSHMLAILDSRSARSADRLRRVPDWFAEWEACLSRFRSDSELSLLNRHTGEQVQVSPTLKSVFQTAIAMEIRSQRLVSPTVLDSLVSAGYDRSFDEMATEVAQGTRMETACRDTATIAWDERSRMITLPPDVHLDFGGVAKGWAAQQTVQRLKIYGPVLMDAGGDIAISGLQRDGQPWQVAIADPFHPEEDLEQLRLGRCGVATSGTDFRHWNQDGKRRHHIIDPRTGKPAETDILSATVIAPSIIEAEMGAKVTLISGSVNGMHWLEAQPSFAGMVVLENGQRLYSQSMEKYLWS